MSEIVDHWVPFSWAEIATTLHLEETVSHCCTCDVFQWANVICHVTYYRFVCGDRGGLLLITLQSQSSCII